MPTLRSIGVHPDLRKRLVVATSTAGGEGEDSVLIPIATPHALLSRHPGALRLADGALESSKAIATPQAESLRHDVAEAMLTQSKTGRHWKRIANAQSTTMSDDTSTQRDDKETRFPTILDLVKYQECFISKRIELRTGCESLDRAIALPLEFSAFSSKNPLSPTVTTSHGQLGVPFGYITQFTGPPASGKSQMMRRLGLTCAKQGGMAWLIHSGPVPHLSGDSEVLENIYIVPAMDGFELLARLAELEGLLQQEEVYEPALMIVDSCSVCLGAVEDESMYATVSSVVKRLTRVYDLATVITNGTVADRQSGGRKAALGQFWNGVADINVWLEAHPNPTRGFKAVVQHHFAREVSNAAHCFSLSTNV